MANTYSLIASNTLSSSATSVSFSSIPNSFTDLVVRYSVRGANAFSSETLFIRFNGVTSSYNKTDLQATGTAAASGTQSSASNLQIGVFNGGTSISNTFTPAEIYIPNYAVTRNKPLGAVSFFESNSTTAGDWYIFADGGFWTNTSAINSIAFSQSSGRDFASGSSFFLYGIKKS